MLEFEYPMLIAEYSSLFAKGFHIIFYDTNIAAPAQTGVSDTGMALEFGLSHFIDNVQGWVCLETMPVCRATVASWFWIRARM